MLTGMGLYLWIIYRIEGGKQGKPPAPERIAERAAEMGLTHVLIKVADAKWPYNVHQGIDLVPPLVSEFHKRGIQAWGWQYIYGLEPSAEATASVKRVTELKLDGFVVNAEIEFREHGMDRAARQYMAGLRAGVGMTPIGFSSFRFPTKHRPLPFEAFLEKSDINMPQVYWVGADNPEAQLARSIAEYKALGWTGQTFPTGAAYKERGWQPTLDQVQRFLDACVAQGLDGANFWEWLHAVQFYESVIKAFDGWRDPVRKDEETEPEIAADALEQWNAMQKKLKAAGRPVAV